MRNKRAIFFTLGLHLILFSIIISNFGSFEHSDISEIDSSSGARGWYSFSSTSEDIHIQGTMAYLALTTGGVEIVDISNQNNPQELGSYQNGTVAYAVYPTGDRLYVAAGMAGLFILNISDPTNPTYLGHYNGGDAILDVKVYGDIAYVCDHIPLAADIIVTLNISDPNNIQFMDSSAVGDYCERLEVVNSIVYAVSRTVNGQLTIINASNPNDLVQINAIAFDEARDIEISGNYAFVCDSNDGIRVVDISIPHQAQVVHTYDPSWLAHRMTIDGEFAYVGTTSTDMMMLNISNPTHIIYMGNHSTPYNTYDIAIHGDFAYVLCGDIGMQCIQVSKTTTYPIQRKALGLSADVRYIDVDGNVAYLSTGLSGIHFINISNAGKFNYMTAIDYFQDGDNYLALEARNGIVYVLNTDGELKILNATNPAAINVIFTLNVGSNLRDLDVQGNMVYISDYDVGLVCVNISDLHNPQIIGSYTSGDFSYTELEIVGHTAYIANSTSGLVLVNVEDPTDPKFINSFNWGQNSNILDVDGDVAFLADDNGFNLIDVSDPMNLFSITEEPTTDPVNDLQVIGNFAVLSLDSGDFQLFNISDRLDAVFYATEPLSSTIYEIEVVSDTLYVCYGSNGLISSRIKATGRADFDEDGLDNLQELWEYDTEPDDLDTDGDMLSDGDEVNTHFIDPLDNDTDSDTLLDGSEVLTLGTLPNDTDTDDDLMPDNWEVQYTGPDPTVYDPTDDPDKDGLINIYEYSNNTSPDAADTDGDGWDDLDEIQAGTDPNNASSFPSGGADSKIITTIVIIAVAVALGFTAYKALKGKKKSKLVKKDEEKGPYFK